MPHPRFEPLTLSPEEWARCKADHTHAANVAWSLMIECEAQAQAAADLRHRLEDWQLKFATSEVLTLDIIRERDELRARVSAAERPAPTCATCEFALAHLCKNQRLIQSPAIGWFVPPSPDFGCTLHEPAAQRSVVDTEKE